MTIDAEGIAHALGGAVRAANGWKARCPAHEDHHASLVVYDRPQGGVNVKCMADCEQGTVVARLRALNLWPSTGARKSAVSDANKEQRKRAETITKLLHFAPPELAAPDWSAISRTPPTAAYEYRDEQGRLLNYVLRWDEIGQPKRILPLTPSMAADGSFHWVYRAPQKYTLYGLELLSERPDADVMIGEGEKTADAGRRLLPGQIFLSFRGGAGAVEKNDFSPLAGRRVTIIPDADEPGRKAAAQVAEKALAVGAAKVCVIKVPDYFPKGWDIADPFPNGHTVDSLLALGADAQATLINNPDGEKLLASYVMSAADLVRLEIKPREFIVEPFLATQSLNMLYAVRGIGKTWVGLTLAICVARGEDFFGYSVERERNVLYIDGEMPLPDLKERLLALAPNPPENLMILPSDVLFREDRPLNIQDVGDRSRIDDLLSMMEIAGNRPDLIIFDNLSSLSGGVDENDNSALDAFLLWLVSLRHAGFAILMIHHAGKSGAQRGASRREDLLDTSIELKKPGKDKDGEEEVEPHQGAYFVLCFP